MTWDRSSREDVVMSNGIEDAELAEIEQRAARAFSVAATPWIAQLETRQAIGGESFIRLGDDPNLDQELYVRLYNGLNEIASPNVGLDAVVDFIADASDAVPRLVAEIRRLRSL
jgi:hypothetical protein